VLFNIFMGDSDTFFSELFRSKMKCLIFILLDMCFNEPLVYSFLFLRYIRLMEVYLLGKYTFSFLECGC